MRGQLTRALSTALHSKHHVETQVISRSIALNDRAKPPNTTEGLSKYLFSRQGDSSTSSKFKNDDHISFLAPELGRTGASFVNSHLFIDPVEIERSVGSISSQSPIRMINHEIKQKDSTEGLDNEAKLKLYLSSEDSFF
jgi:hypothetical protein